MQILAHNMSELPWNSPQWAHDILKETRKIEHCVGFINYVGGCLSSEKWELFGRGLGYYGQHNEPYADERWIEFLKERFGDESAAKHFLNAYNISAGITPGVNAIAWCPHDGRCPHQLILKYWHWTDQDERFSNFANPARGATLLPVRHYSRVVAQRGRAFRNNDGSDYQWTLAEANRRLHDHPGEQELIWGHVDYQVTPEAHMAKIRAMGEACLAEATAAMPRVKSNLDQAALIQNRMKAYKLLTDYYERKVLAAISALIYSYNRDPAEKTQAERLADQTVELYERAANFIYEALDQKRGEMKGGWHDEYGTLPKLIQMEREERARLPILFHWPDATERSLQR